VEVKEGLEVAGVVVEEEGGGVIPVCVGLVGATVLAEERFWRAPELRVSFPGPVADATVLAEEIPPELRVSVPGPITGTTVLPEERFWVPGVRDAVVDPEGATVLAEERVWVPPGVRVPVVDPEGAGPTVLVEEIFWCPPSRD
jgi:hypothetical protein